MRRYSSEIPRQETFQAFGRIPQLDIYAKNPNLARAEAVRAGRPSLKSSADEVKGLSVIILSKNRPDYVIPLITQLLDEQAHFKGQGLKLEILVGDTGSDDLSVLQFYQEVGGHVHVESGMSYHFSRCNNSLALKACGDVLLFLNNDIRLPQTPGLLFRAFQEYRSSPANGAFGFVMQYECGEKIQHMGIDFLEEKEYRGLPFHVNHGAALPAESIPEKTPCAAVTGASLMVGRKLFLDVNGFDPCYESECQDVALCLELLRLGYENVCLNFGKMVHFENGTRRMGDEHWGDRARLLRKYGSFIEVLFSEGEEKPSQTASSIRRSEAA